MTLHLYTRRLPSGRCAVLAQKLARVARSGDGIRVAERLFAGHHQADNPAVVHVRSPEAVDDLQAACAEFGITVEVRDDPATAL
jgi:hypothetical protein